MGFIPHCKNIFGTFSLASNKQIQGNLSLSDIVGWMKSRFGIYTIHWVHPPIFRMLARHHADDIAFLGLGILINLDLLLLLAGSGVDPKFTL